MDHLIFQTELWQILAKEHGIWLLCEEARTMYIITSELNMIYCYWSFIKSFWDCHKIHDHHILILISTTIVIIVVGFFL